MFENDYLMHYGIKGQKWGVRRYQNTDGSWTAAGRARYSKGSGKRAKYGSQLDPKTAKRVEELNKQIDKENLKLQKRNARSYGYDQASIKKAAATAAATNAAINAASARTSGRFTADLLGMDQADINSIGRSSAVSGGLAGAGLGAVSGALKGAAIKAVGKSSIGKKSREAKIQRMVAERNALDPSQASRKGRTLTEKEFNRQANVAKGVTIGGSAGLATFPLSPIGTAVGAAVGSRSTKGNSYDYNDYLKNTTTYGSKKKAKYGTRLNAHDRNRVEMLNDEIDALNYDYQRSHAGAKAALASKPKAYAKLEAAKLAYPGALAGLGIGGALATNMSSPKQAALAFGGGTLIGALGGAAIGSHSATKKFKKEIKSFKDEPYDPEIKRELNSLIAERNHLDPSQKNRKGRVITKEEYSDAYNLGRNMLEGGNKHKGLVSDEIYNDYLKNTTTYGSKKKRR